MGFPKGTKLGKHKRDSQGRLLNKDGSLYKVVPNQGQWNKGRRNSPATEFTKGITPHNKGKRLEDYVPEYSLKRIKEAQFKKGNLPHTAKPLGSISRIESRSKAGRLRIEYSINIDWKGNRKPHNSFKWFIWEVEHQQDRPQGMVLALKNGNPDDIRLDNMEMITRAENLRRNSP